MEKSNGKKASQLLLNKAQHINLKLDNCQASTCENLI